MSDPHLLPYVDEHTASVAATPERVWDALLTTLDNALSQPASATYARAVGCVPSRTTGPRPLEVGSELPGFRVTTAAPGEELVLTGRHRFSTYAMILRLDDGGTGGTTMLRAETRAAFPGLLGGVYRLAVIGSRGHVLGMRRLLSSTRQRAEA